MYRGSALLIKPLASELKWDITAERSLNNAKMHIKVATNWILDNENTMILEYTLMKTY